VTRKGYHLKGGGEGGEKGAEAKNRVGGTESHEENAGNSDFNGQVMEGRRTSETGQGSRRGKSCRGVEGRYRRAAPAMLQR